MAEGGKLPGDPHGSDESYSDVSPVALSATFRQEAPGARWTDVPRSVRHNDCRLAFPRDTGRQETTGSGQENGHPVSRRDENEIESTGRRQVMSIANTNHEIRTPLQAIVGMTDLLFETPLTEKQRSYLHSIRCSSNVLLKIIEDILAFSTLEAGQASIHKEVVDIEDVIEPVLLMLGRQAHSKGVELICDVAPHAHAIGDPDRLRQILTNLVGNAIKFTDHGEVIVEVSQVTDAAGTDCIEFAVKDTGIGIDVNRKHDMFLPFSRVGSAAEHTYGGTGLGLAICKRLVEIMDGTIDIDARPGGGTVARFRVPAPVHPPKTGDSDLNTKVVAADEELRDSDLTTKVLVVDDNPRAGQTIATALGASGMRAERVIDGASAIRRLLECADTDPFRVAIIDADMPEMDGIATAREIRSILSIRETGLVILTSLAKPLPPGAASQLKARCLDKPVVPRLLDDTIAHVLSGNWSATRNRDAEPALNIDAGSRLLVVDDNPVSRQVFADMATVLGFAVDVAKDGDSARKALASRRYAVMLLDCQLPDIDGCELAAEVRERYPGTARPAMVAVTASASAKDKDRCLHAGMDDYLAKPVTLNGLRMTLQRWMPGKSGKEDAAESTSDPGAAETTFHRRTLGGGAATGQLMEIFIEDSTERLSALARMFEQDELESDEIVREAHALKSGCLFVEANALAELSGQLERRAREDNVPEARKIFERLRHEFHFFRLRSTNARSPA